MSRDQLKQQIKACRLFDHFEESELEKIVPFFNTRQLDSGEVLFDEGDLSDKVFILISGRLVSYINTDSGYHVLGEIAVPGETIGEMGAIANKPRTASIRARKRSELLEISADNLLRIDSISGSTKILQQLLNLTISRFSGSIKKKSQKSLSQIIGVEPAVYDDRLEGLEDVLRHVASQASNAVAVFTVQELEANYPDSDLRTKREIISKIVLSNNFIFFINDGCSLKKFQEWVDEVHSNLDRLVICTSTTFLTKREVYELNAKTKDEVFAFVKKDLLILDKGEQKASINLEQSEFNRTYYCHRSSANDFARFVRLLTGCGTGLVMSGGMGRSLGNLGVLRALNDLKIPIDYIGGVSAGAISGAIFSFSQCDFETAKQMHIEFAKISTKLRPVFIPLAAVLSGKEMNEALQNIFGDTRVEELRYPFFSVSADIYNSKENIQRTGIIWKNVRASAAVPGLYPPVRDREKILIDGGVVNNLPIDVMHEFMEKTGMIFAVDVSEEGLSRKKVTYNYPPFLRTRELFFNFFRRKKNKLHFPSIGEIIVETMMISSLERAKQVAPLADVFIKPDISPFGILDLKTMDQFIEVAYSETMKQYERYQKSELG